MNIFKTGLTLGVAALLASPQDGNAQNTVTDQYGTTFITDVLPPSIQGSIERQRARSDNDEPLIATRRKGGQTRFQINHNPTTPDGTDVGSCEPEYLIDQLLGVVLVPSPKDVRTNGWPGVEGVWHDFQEFPPEVGWTLQNYMGKPVSLTSLDQMVKDVVLAYREGDRPVVDVLLPEQNISCGVVQLVVVESKLSRIRVEGADVATEEYIRSQMRVRKGEVIRSSEVLHDLAWLNRDPYRQVDMSYAPGGGYGETELVLRPQHNATDTAWIGYEDSGNRFLGQSRFVMGMNFGELGFQPGRRLAYQFSSDIDFNSVRSHSLVYSHDLPWRHNLTFSGSFVDIDGGPLPDGENWGLSARYNIPLQAKETYICEPLFGTIQRRRDFFFGFDFKATDNVLEYGVIPGQPQTEIYQGIVGYNEFWQHRGGISEFNIAGVFSNGGWSAHNTDQNFLAARGGNARANYGYLTAGFEHQHELMNDWSMRAALNGQLATRTLQTSEQFGAGGHSTVRGFDQYSIIGDEGIHATAELYTPELVNNLRLLTFFDAASTQDKSLNNTVSQNIAAAGVGMRYTMGYFKLRVDYGHPVMSDTIDNNIDTSGRFHIGATATF